LKANTDGIVKAVLFKEGALVGEKQRLIELEATG
jgi:biotin carboxyl carrier protein